MDAPTIGLVTLANQEEQVMCGHCGTSSHYYKAAVDWTTFDTQGYQRGDCRVWARHERKHADNCCRNEGGADA